MINNMLIKFLYFIHILLLIVAKLLKIHETNLLPCQLFQINL